MVDAWGRISTGRSKNAVRDNLYRETEGNRDIVGGVTTTIQSVCKGEGIQRGWTQEGGFVAPRDNRETTLVHLGRNIVGD